MSQALAELLGKPKEEVAKWVGTMEAATGYKSQDVRILADMNLSLRQKISVLGLDPDDTTSEELYHALVAKYGRDSALVNKALDVDDRAGFAVRQNLAIGLLGHIAPSAHSWTLKNPAARAILKKLPPKKVMKAWGYRSVDSLLKREDAAEVVLAAKATEPAIWQKNFAAALRKAGQADYHFAHVRVLRLNAERSYGQDSCLHDSQLGVVALNPAKNHGTSVLSMALLLLRGIEQASLRFEAKPLTKINPALSFWRGAEHLLARAEGPPVSLNINDVSRSYDEASKFGEHSFSHAADSLFNKLAAGYDALAAQVSGGAAQLETQVDKSLHPVQDLALEAVEA